MIFSGDLADKVLDGSKTQTRRPVAPGKPCRYEAGKTYAVQRKRGTVAIGRILVLSVQKVPVCSLSRADARAEGFDSPDGFYVRWQEFYGRLSGECWRLEFEVIPA